MKFTLYGHDAEKDMLCSNAETSPMEQNNEIHLLKMSTCNDHDFCRMFNCGEFKEEEQEKNLQSLTHKVEEVYRSCISDNEVNIR